MKNSTRSKSKVQESLGSEEKRALNELMGTIEGDPNPWGDGVSEQSLYDAPPKFPQRVNPDGSRSTVVKQPTEDMEAGPIYGGRTHGTRTMLRAMEGDQTPLTPEEEEALMRLLVRTARPS